MGAQKSYVGYTFQVVPRAVMRSHVAPVDDGIAQRAVGAVIGDSCTNTPAPALVRSRRHVGKPLEGLVDAHVATLKRQSVFALLVTLAQLRVVGKGLSVPDQLDGQVVQLLEVVARVAGRVGMYTDRGQVLHNRVLELHGLL